MTCPPAWWLADEGSSELNAEWEVENWFKLNESCVRLRFFWSPFALRWVTSSMHNPFIHINNNIMNINCSCCSTMLHCSQKLWSRAKAIERVYWIQQIDRTKTEFFSCFSFGCCRRYWPALSHTCPGPHTSDWRFQRASYRFVHRRSIRQLQTPNLKLRLWFGRIFLNGAYAIQSHLMMNQIFTWIFTERRKTWLNKNPVNYRIPYGKINCASLARWENGRKLEPCNILLHLFTWTSVQFRSCSLLVGTWNTVSQQCPTDIVKTPRLHAYS